MLQEAPPICRFCLSEESSCSETPLINLFQNYTFDSLRKKTEDCLRVKLSPDDKIPPLICQRCLDKVNYYSEFLESVYNSGKQLGLLYGLEDCDYSSANSRDGEEQRVSYEGLNSSKFESDDSDLMNRPFNPIHTRKSSEDLSVEKKKWLMDAGDSTKPMKRCRICHIMLFGPKEIKKHMATHWREQETANQMRYQCQEKVREPFKKSKSTILRKNKLEKHHSKHSAMTSFSPPKKNPNKKIICKVCQKVFRKEARLAAHMKKQHPTQKIRFTSNKKRRIRHRKGLKVSVTGLSKSKGFRCKFCGKNFDALRHLHEHLSSHSKSKKRCPKCNKQFAFQKHFEKHVWRCFYGPTKNVARKTSSLPLIGK